MKDKKEFISEIDYNKSSKGCSPCLSECKKINDRINKRNLSDIDLNKSSSACSPCQQECEKINKRINKKKLDKIEPKEVPHLLKVFDF